jgi:hypothetical protein
VTNPHIRRVYEGYFHAFETLRRQPRVASLADNGAFCALLRRLVDEHGAARARGRGAGGCGALSCMVGGRGGVGGWVRGWVGLCVQGRHPQGQHTSSVLAHPVTAHLARPQHTPPHTPPHNTPTRRAPAGPLLDQLARGLVECRAKRLVGPALQLDTFLDNMLRRWGRARAGARGGGGGGRERGSA